MGLIAHKVNEIRAFLILFQKQGSGIPNPKRFIQLMRNARFHLPSAIQSKNYDGFFGCYAIPILKKFIVFRGFQ